MIKNFLRKWEKAMPKVIMQEAELIGLDVGMPSN